MRLISTILGIVFSLFLITFHTFAQEEIIHINYPPDRTVKELNLIGISVSVPEDFAGEIRVVVNGEEDQKIRVSSEGRFRCFSVALIPGVNNIEIMALENGKVVDMQTLSVFRRSDIIGKYKIPPTEYSINLFHEEEHPECKGCHTLTPSEADLKPININHFNSTTRDEAFEKSSTCYSCHRSIMSFPYVHGPASVWSCLSCHDPQASPKYEVLKPDTELCFKCHIPQKKEWTSKKYIHGPVNIGKCTICHSPHASENPFNLYKAPWDLCVNCHADKGTGKHVLGDSFSTEGHPTRDRPDPVRIGKELSCTSCHNPHASNIQHLWSFEVNSTFELCQRCHHKRVE